MPLLIVNVINETRKVGRGWGWGDLVKTADETGSGETDESRSSPSTAAL